MKNHLTSFMLLFLAVGSLSACREESKLPAPKLSASLPLIFPQISTDPEKNHFDISRARSSQNNLPRQTNPTRPVFEFTFDVDNTRDKKVKAVEVYKSLLSNVTSFGGTNGRVFSGGSFGTRVLYKTYTSWPVTISLDSQEALEGLQRLIAQSGTTAPALALPYLLTVKATNNAQANLISVVPNNDAIVFTFEYILEDDTRITLTPVTKTSVVDNINGTVAKQVEVLATTTQVNAPFSAVAIFRN